MRNMEAGKEPEHAVGIISANVRLGFGFEQLILVVSNRRIVVVHKGKKGAVGLASILVLGSHGGSFLDPDKPSTPLQGALNTELEKVNIDKVLASNKNNFDVRYDEMITVELERRTNATGITVVTDLDKFEFFTGMDAQEVANLLRPNLGEKLSVRISMN